MLRGHLFAHLRSSKHWKSQKWLESKEARERTIVEHLWKYNEETHIQGGKPCLKIIRFNASKWSPRFWSLECPWARLNHSGISWRRMLSVLLIDATCLIMSPLFSRKKRVVFALKSMTANFSDFRWHLSTGWSAGSYYTFCWPRLVCAATYCPITNAF